MTLDETHETTPATTARSNATQPADEAVADTLAHVLDLAEWRRRLEDPAACAAHDARIGAELAARAERVRAKAQTQRAATLGAWGVPPVFLRERAIDAALVPAVLSAWADTWPASLPRGGGALLEGDVGVGKTSAAVYLLGRLFATGDVVGIETGLPRYRVPRGMFVSWDDLAEAAALSHMVDTGEQARALLARAVGAALLVVDDWGSTDRGFPAQTRVEALVAKRWERCRPTILTANTRGGEFGARFARTHSRVTHRAGSAPGAVWLDGVDLRRGGIR